MQTRTSVHGLQRWIPEAILLSVVTIGEIRRGIESVRRRDPKAARALERWLRRVLTDYGDRILIIDLPVAEEWARLNVLDPLQSSTGCWRRRRRFTM